MEWKNPGHFHPIVEVQGVVRSGVLAPLAAPERTTPWHLVKRGVGLSGNVWASAAAYLE